MAEAVRDAAGGEKAIVLGNGFGGFVALNMLIDHPGIAARAVLADCGAAFSEPGRAAFRAMAGAAEAMGLAAVADTAMRRLFAPDFQAANPDLMAERRAAFLRTDPTVFGAACAALAALDLRPEVPRVRVPVLVLVGEEDEATPPAMSEELAGLLPDARLTILPGCAHVPQLQAPERFVAAVCPSSRAPKIPVVPPVPHRLASRKKGRRGAPSIVRDRCACLRPPSCSPWLPPWW
jgi:3-oxoadipate enol-lactonase